MLGGLMETNPKFMWNFEKFFDESSRICDLKLINLLILNTSQVIEMTLEKNARYFEITFIYIQVHFSIFKFSLKTKA